MATTTRESGGSGGGGVVVQRPTLVNPYPSGADRGVPRKGPTLPDLERDRDAFIRPLPPISPPGVGVTGQTAATSDPIPPGAEETPADAASLAPTGAGDSGYPTVPDVEGIGDREEAAAALHKRESKSGSGEDHPTRRGGSRNRSGWWKYRAVADGARLLKVANDPWMTRIEKRRDV